MRIIDTIPEIVELLADADHVDVTTAESEADLRQFVAGAIGWRPAWMRALFVARSGLARVLRLRQPDVAFGAAPNPADLSFTRGAKIGFFTVTDAAEDRFVVMEASDNHLTGRLVIATAPAADGPAAFEVTTVVKYHRWTGPVYFNAIRPFHHLVVSGMTGAGARAATAA